MIVVLVSVPLIVFTPLACVAPPVKPVPVGANQVYVVPAGTIPLVTSTGVTLNRIPPQAAPDIGAMLARALTVTVNWNDAPAPQATVLGVTVYVADCAILVGLIRLPVMFDALLPGDRLVIPPVTIGVDQL